VVETSTGKVMSREQEFDRWYPASLTKLMTVYTVFREIRAGTISLMSPVKISTNALSEPPSKMGFPVGTVMNVDTAIRILMVKSANDIAVALAEAAAGSEQGFVEKMNAYAAQLGMQDSHFINPNGLYDPRQFTSARDLAVLTIALKKEFPAYAGYFKIPAIRHGKRILQNHNPLLQRYAGTNGMKTGFVCESGLNIVASAKRGGRELVAVVLGGPTGQERNVRAAKLLSESFGKSSFFIRDKLDTIRPSGITRTVPVNLRETVCPVRKKTRKKDTAAATKTAFTLNKPDLDALEKRYLQPVGHNARVDQIVLGNASGPDPFGLLEDVPVTNLSAFVASGGDAKEWPTVPGKKRIKVPLPVPRPER
jgi:D-alanyl-D-alanine carboxypeptidase